MSSAFFFLRLIHPPFSSQPEGLSISEELAITGSPVRVFLSYFSFLSVLTARVPSPRNHPPLFIGVGDAPDNGPNPDLILTTPGSPPYIGLRLSQGPPRDFETYERAFL